MSQLRQNVVLMLNAVGAQICCSVECSRVTENRKDEDEIERARRQQWSQGG